MRQVVRSVSGNNLVFYFSTILWLRFQQEIVWVNINFETRDLHPNIELTDIIRINVWKSKFLYKENKATVEWNKHSGEQH